MPEYRRIFQPGGMFFFTLVVHQRRPLFSLERARVCLRESFREIQAVAPFEIVAIVLLPEHLHCLWQLPPTDSGYSARWSRIKRRFTQRYLAAGGTALSLSNSRRHKRERGIWQRRFWEHTIRDERDMIKHIEYIHYNPVKHGLVDCPHKYPYSSFARFVTQDLHEPDWQCCCEGRTPPAPVFDSLREQEME